MSKDKFLAKNQPPNFDDKIDTAIQECLELGSNNSFITFAGAGSGKTYSLKKALEYLKDKYSTEFIRQGKQVAVVTFTNNAANEINERIEQSPLFKISTIHSFCWSAISGFNEDIRQWYLHKIPYDIQELEIKENKGRAGKASDARKKDIARLRERLDWLSLPRTFIYDPNGVNIDRNALSHADVLKIFSSFLSDKPLFSEVIVSNFPFIFIDESQDTDKQVINAFFNLQKQKSKQIVIGLFGDIMQRIFGGGESELGKSKPEGWKQFNKEMNHRSARRVIGLGNQIRSEDDGRIQFAREDAKEGLVRYFLIPQGTAEKESLEAGIRKEMAKITSDEGWLSDNSKETAVLLLEHKMAGQRLGFNELWDKLSKSKKIRDRIAEGKNTELNFFADIVFPLAEASKNKQQAEVMRILRENTSPLLDDIVFDCNQEDPLLPARNAEQAFRAVVTNPNVSFRSVLEALAKYDLLTIPNKLTSFLPNTNSSTNEVVTDDFDGKQEESIEEVKDNSEIGAWAEALETDFYQIRNYKDYTEDNSLYRTHQGVKGNEFERVMVVMDDADAGGFMFSYEQYFGVKPLSASSQQKHDAGEETGLDRTSRLFYVTSTRAKSSLAHVIYTSNVDLVKQNLIERKFAQENEIVIYSLADN